MDLHPIIEKWAYRIGVSVQLWPCAPDDWSVVEKHPAYKMLKKYLDTFLDEAIDEYNRPD